VAGADGDTSWSQVVVGHGAASERVAGDARVGDRGGLTALLTGRSGPAAAAVDPGL